MMKKKLTSTERVLTTLSGGIPDRVPFFLPVTMHGALEMGVGLDEYYQSATLVTQGQLRLHSKYKNDFLLPFFYGGVELEAFGGEVEFYTDGPPNAVEPLFSDMLEIKNLEVPKIGESKVLQKVLATIKNLHTAAAGETLIVGVVMSPFSLPVMQLGFEQYVNLLYTRPDLVKQLYAINEVFCAKWANAQLQAGANAIGYFDPVSSPTVLSQEMFERYGLPLMKRTMKAIKGPSAALLASGLSIPLFNDLTSTPAVIVGVSSDEDLGLSKEAAGGKITVMGNLNGIEMRRWSQELAREKVKQAILAGAPGGRFILSDTHGEIPIQVPEDTLLAICDAVLEFGQYPKEVNNE